MKLDFLYRALEFEEDPEEYTVERKLVIICLKMTFASNSTAGLFNTKKITEKTFFGLAQRNFGNVMSPKDLSETVRGVYQEGGVEKSACTLGNLLYLAIIYFVKNVHPANVDVQNRIFGLFQEDGWLRVETIALLLTITNRRLASGTEVVKRAINLLTGKRQKIPLREFQTLCFDMFELTRQKVEGQLTRLHRMSD